MDERPNGTIDWNAADWPRADLHDLHTGRTLPDMTAGVDTVRRVAQFYRTDERGGIVLDDLSRLPIRDEITYEGPLEVVFAGIDGAPPPSLGRVWATLAQWSDATFGDITERGPLGPARHLLREAQEVVDAIEAGVDDAAVDWELADALLLVLDTARRAGRSPAALLGWALQKIQTNAARTYPKPERDQVSEHVRDDADGTQPTEP